MEYIIDLKVYSLIPQSELGLDLPSDQLRNGKIPVGVHQIILNTTEEQLDQLQAKAFENSDVKILGIHRLKEIENI